MIMIINRIYKFRDIESPVFGPSLIMMDNETAHDNKMPWRQRSLSLNTSTDELGHVLGCVKALGWSGVDILAVPGPVTDTRDHCCCCGGGDREHYPAINQ